MSVNVDKLECLVWRHLPVLKLPQWSARLRVAGRPSPPTWSPKLWSPRALGPIWVNV